MWISVLFVDSVMGMQQLSKNKKAINQIGEQLINECFHACAVILRKSCISEAND
jgi:hypothetical protein